MPSSAPRRTLLLALALLAASCGGGADRGRSIASLELIDFTPGAMFRQASLQLGRPYVLEQLPPRDEVAPTHDLRMEDTDERAFLEAVVALEPAYAFDMDGAAWALFPAEAAAQDSVYERTLSSFSADAGAFEVLKEISLAALPEETQVVMPGAGQARPVRIEAKDAKVRDLMREVAAQAQLGIVVERGFVRVSVVPE